MEKFSSKLIEFFVSNDLIKNEDKEIYKYAVNIILSPMSTQESHKLNASSLN